MKLIEWLSREVRITERRAEEVSERETGTIGEDAMWFKGFASALRRVIDKIEVER